MLIELLFLQLLEQHITIPTTDTSILSRLLQRVYSIFLEDLLPSSSECITISPKKTCFELRLEIFIATFEEKKDGGLSVEQLNDMSGARALAWNNVHLFSRTYVSGARFASSWKQNPQDSKGLRVGVIGASFEMGQPKTGVAKSPNLLLKEMDIVKKIKDLGHNVDDRGILEHTLLEENGKSEGTALNRGNVHAFNKKLKNEVASVLKDNRFCLVVGGDHSIGLGTVSGFTQVHPDGCLLWVDAHSDINTPFTSDSGNMHGMPVAYQLREIYKGFENACSISDWHEPRLSPDRIAFIGLRSVDSGEEKILRDLNIEAYYMNDIDELGMKEVLRRSLTKINPKKDRPLHVSFDIDSLDPLEAPATGTPVRGGLTLREGLQILYECHKSGCLAALDLVEVNTHLGNKEESKRTLSAAEHLIFSAFGHLLR